MSTQCAAGSSKLDGHVRKPTTRSYIHVRLSQLWESDLMKRQNLSGVSRATYHQCREHLLNDFSSLLQPFVEKIGVGFTVRMMCL